MLYLLITPIHIELLRYAYQQQQSLTVMRRIIGQQYRHDLTFDGAYM